MSCNSRNVSSTVVDARCMTYAASSKNFPNVVGVGSDGDDDGGSGSDGDDGDDGDDDDGDDFVVARSP